MSEKRGQNSLAAAACLTPHAIGAFTFSFCFSVRLSRALHKTMFNLDKAAQWSHVDNASYSLRAGQRPLCPPPSPTIPCLCWESFQIFLLMLCRSLTWPTLRAKKRHIFGLCYKEKEKGKERKKKKHNTGGGWLCFQHLLKQSLHSWSWRGFLNCQAIILYSRKNCQLDEKPI